MSSKMETTSRDYEDEERWIPPDDLRCARDDGREWRCKRWRVHDSKFCQQHHIYFLQKNLKKKKKKKKNKGKVKSIMMAAKKSEFQKCNGIQGNEEEKQEEEGLEMKGEVNSPPEGNPEELQDKEELESDREGEVPPEDRRCTRNDGKEWKCTRWRLEDSKYCQHHHAYIQKLRFKQKKRNKKDKVTKITKTMKRLKFKECHGSEEGDQKDIQEHQEMNNYNDLEDSETSDENEDEIQKEEERLEKNRGKEKNLRSTVSDAGWAENIMAIVDPSRIQNEDRISFLEAVRDATLGSDCGITPSRKMYETIFNILKESPSLELIMSSYQLLLELDKNFPKVNFSNPSKSVVAKEPWSPFSLGQKNRACGKMEMNESGNPFDSLGFYQLIKNIARDFTQAESLKHFGDMMMFQYLVYVLEKDFISRNAVYKETNSWYLLGESALNMLLVCRGISYRGLMKNCISILSTDNSKTRVVASDFALNTSYTEIQKATSAAVEKFLSLAIELDKAKKQAESQGQTIGIDSLRTPLIEMIQNELSYDKQILSQFLQAFSDPKWKIEIIRQFISNYSKKSSICSQKPSISSGNTALDDILSYFLSETSTENILNKISLNVVQLLLAHAFQAYFKLQRINEDKTGIVQVCKDVILAFQNLKRVCKNMEMIPIGKQALFTAVATVMAKSSNSSEVEVLKS